MLQFKATHLLSHSSVGQQCRLAQLGSLLWSHKVLTDWAFTEKLQEECASSLIQLVGRKQVLAV